MNNPSPQNIAESVKAKLLNLARKKNRPFQEILQFYGMERFLFRLSKAGYKDKFILKGALLFKVWDVLESRTSLDIDALAKTSNSLSYLIQVVADICIYTPELDDGIQFDPTSVKGVIMPSQKDYEGIRIRFKGYLGSAMISLQFDIGFGDVVTPFPEEINYPTLLNSESPSLLGYPPVTVIAEKLQTIVEKGLINSRIKDYYDIWLILRWPNFNFEDLQKAILYTFEKRKTKFDFEQLKILLKTFSIQPEKSKLWEQFLEKQTEVIHPFNSLEEMIESMLDSLRKVLFHKK